MADAKQQPNDARRLPQARSVAAHLCCLLQVNRTQAARATQATRPQRRRRLSHSMCARTGPSQPQRLTLAGTWKYTWKYLGVGRVAGEEVGPQVGPRVGPLGPRVEPPHLAPHSRGSRWRVEATDPYPSRTRTSEMSTSHAKK